MKTLILILLVIITNTSWALRANILNEIPTQMPYSEDQTSTYSTPICTVTHYSFSTQVELNSMMKKKTDCFMNIIKQRLNVVLQNSDISTDNRKLLVKFQKQLNRIDKVEWHSTGECLAKSDTLYGYVHPKIQTTINMCKPVLAKFYDVFLKYLNLKHMVECSDTPIDLDLFTKMTLHAENIIDQLIIATLLHENHHLTMRKKEGHSKKFYSSLAEIGKLLGFNLSTNSEGEEITDWIYKN
jgi:hypothetical protein